MIDEGLARTDVLTIHIPCPLVVHLMDARQVAKRRPLATFIYTARGGAKDDVALVDALKRGVMVAAGPDVYENEPVPGS